MGKGTFPIETGTIQSLCHGFPVQCGHNAERLVALAEKAGQLFIEAVFHDYAALTARNRHLTAGKAGALARAANVRHAFQCIFLRAISIRSID